MTPSIKNRRASMAPPSTTSQKRKKRRRATSVLSTESRNRQGSIRPADDELAMVKAAAMKLLNNTSNHIPNMDLDVVIDPVKLNDNLQDCSGPLSKKIKFETSPLSIDQSNLTHLNFSESEAVIDQTFKENIPESIQKISHKKKASFGSNLLRQCIDPLAKSQDEPMPDSYEDKGERFEVKVRDIFARNAIVNAFQATLNEFRYYHCDRVTLNTTSESLLPLTESQRRSTSLLYYGTPRPTPPASVRKKKASKKPKLDTFVPNPRTSSELTIPVSAPRQASPVLSDLDMEEYLEMFGDFAPSEVLEPRNSSNESRKDMVELSSSSSSAVKPTTTSMTIPEEKAKDNEEEEMMISEDSSKANSPIPFNNSTLSSSSTTRTTPVPAQAPILETSINPNLESSIQLQKDSLTNALNAQYWAGYYTALYHRSVGFTLPNLPPGQGASSKSLPCPPDSIHKTGWEAGKKAADDTVPNRG
ncbi:hypothetical protein DFH28DRAFT_957494 [Melampsora americana]|nr:hypothetical protein DFH28DRAFT_957494 [Melampsora americana]